MTINGEEQWSLADRERQVAELRRSPGGPDPEVLDAAVFSLMAARRESGDMIGAVESAEELLAARTDTLGPTHPDTLAVASMAANWRYHAGDSAGGAAALHELIPVLTEVIGPDHRDTLTARHTLAGQPGTPGDLNAELAVWVLLYADEQRALGAEDPLTLAARYGVALARRQLGDTIGARDEAERVLAARRRILGEQHPDTLVTALASAIWLGEAGDEEAAAAALGELQGPLHAVLGHDHESTLTARHTWALWRPDDDVDRLETVSEWEVLVDDERRVLGEQHPLTVSGQSVLAGQRALWRQWVEGPSSMAVDYSVDMNGVMDTVVRLKKELARNRRVYGELADVTLTSCYDLAAMLLQHGQCDPVGPLVERLIADCEVAGDQPELMAAARSLRDDLMQRQRG